MLKCLEKIVVLRGCSGGLCLFTCALPRSTRTEGLCTYLHMLLFMN